MLDFLVEQRIEEAVSRGELENLPGEDHRLRASGFDRYLAVPYLNFRTAPTMRWFLFKIRQIAYGLKTD